MIDILRSRAGKICQDAVHLLSDFSGIHERDYSVAGITFISANGKFSWNELPSDGKRLQVRLLPEIDRFSELLQVLGKNLPGAAQRKIEQNLNAMRRAVEQNTNTFWRTPNEACVGFEKYASQVDSILTEYFGSSPSRVIAIPDTNALLTHPDIESWKFEDIRYFTVILAPTILSELDGMKIHHRNPDVREKASTLIRKFKEYRRRGSLLEGVTVVKDRISLRAIAQEPEMSQTLSWFDPSNADDRFLATGLEIIRNNLSAQTYIVTFDINMQNKAELAGIPILEIGEERRECD